MELYITSDLHFGQRTILQYCAETRAKYGTVENMTVQMIEEWNSIVQPEDTTYILGDVSFYSLPKTVEILQALNGNKFLVAGNHDRSFVDRKKFRDCFVKVTDYKTFTYKPLEIRVVMMHYPILEWYGMQHGAVHCFGHMHGRPTGLEPYRAVDVGMDATGRVVSRLDDIVKLAMTKEIRRRGSVEL